MADGLGIKSWFFSYEYESPSRTLLYILISILRVLRVAHDKIDEGHTRGKIVLAIDL